jgi:hypothetical protein
MGGEDKSERCHRSKLIGATMEELVIAVDHIDEEGCSLSREGIMPRDQGYILAYFVPGSLLEELAPGVQVGALYRVE